MEPRRDPAWITAEMPDSLHQSVSRSPRQRPPLRPRPKRRPGRLNYWAFEPPRSRPCATGLGLGTPRRPNSPLSAALRSIPSPNVRARSQRGGGKRPITVPSIRRTEKGG